MVVEAWFNLFFDHLKIDAFDEPRKTCFTNKNVTFPNMGMKPASICVFWMIHADHT